MENVSAFQFFIFVVPGMPNVGFCFFLFPVHGKIRRIFNTPVLWR